MCIEVYACVYSLQCVLIRIPCDWCLSACNYNKLATRTAHGVLREFDPLKESIEDFRNRFEFYCLANNIHGKEEAVQDRKQALFVTLLGQATFAKLKTLASPTTIRDLTLDQIMEYLVGHYKPQTIEIAERFSDTNVTMNLLPTLYPNCDDWQRHVTLVTTWKRPYVINLCVDCAIQRRSVTYSASLTSLYRWQFKRPLQQKQFTRKYKV